MDKHIGLEEQRWVIFVHMFKYTNICARTEHTTAESGAKGCVAFQPRLIPGLSLLTYFFLLVGRTPDDAARVLVCILDFFVRFSGMTEAQG